MSANSAPTRRPTRTSAIELWQRTWQAAYPQIAFAQRVEWWRGALAQRSRADGQHRGAEDEDKLAGFVTIDRKTGYLDQLVVAPEAWGRGYCAHAGR